jgi:hypothetical protein
VQGEIGEQGGQGKEKVRNCKLEKASSGIRDFMMNVTCQTFNLKL